ncbi:hypothetical protein EVAR_12221_1 [Eumeta japonica]|uniref:Uncharacterized protein n=1 Tax=Eumeta variegata TaxID=151549 RepID=A0A4C1UH23_EUMVA|nr:hypothetical protein EVAR_12221_1 [Eumeta japonica]
MFALCDSVCRKKREKEAETKSGFGNSGHILERSRSSAQPRDIQDFGEFSSRCISTGSRFSLAASSSKRVTGCDQQESKHY